MSDDLAGDGPGGGRGDAGGLAGARALVTGGSSGIGLAAARLLTLRKATVAVLDLVPPPHGAALHHVQGDVSDDASVRRALDEIGARFGGLDLLVNNAGIGSIGTVEDNADEEWRRLFEVNVLGMVRVTRAALPLLRRSSQGVIVNTGSIAGDYGIVARAAYAATKGAVHALTRAMAADLLAEGIRVNCVAPGTADTPWIGRLLERAADPAAERAALAARQPHGRLVSAEEVADAIAYLASPSAASTTGVILHVDGGFSSLRPPARSVAPAPPSPAAEAPPAESSG